MKYSNKKLNSVAYFISQYIWIPYFIIPIIVGLLWSKKTPVSTIHSSSKVFNKLSDPLIFAHLSDIHVNDMNPDSINSFQTNVQLLEKISPEFILLTGDIVDNYDYNSFPRYGDQFEKYWQLYQRYLSPISHIPIIEIGGNHDMFGVKAVNSPRNFILDYTHSSTRQNTNSLKDFTVRSFQVGQSNTTIITMNPFYFPTAHPPLLFFTTVTTQMLDWLEEEVSKCQSKCIIISHYPSSMTHSHNSSKGFKFEDIIGAHKSVLAFLSGHTHPTNPTILHHGQGGLEIVGPAGYQRSKFGIVTVDNEAFSWSTIDNQSPAKGVISYPAPYEQLTPNTIFNDITNTDIRVIMFSSKTDHEINFVISSDTNENIYTGQLVYSRLLNNNSTLYSFPMSQAIKEKGVYTITFSGDFDGTRKFIVDETCKVGGEVYPAFPRALEVVFAVYLPLLLVLILITLPFSKILVYEDLEDRIENNELQPNWAVTVLFGIFLIRTRFQRNAFPLKFIVFLCVLMSLGPLMFFESEGAIGMIAFFGYYINEQFIHADYGTFYSLIYLVVVCMPVITLLSSFGVKEWSKVLIPDIVFSCLMIVADFIVVFRLVHESVGPSYLVYCISFIFIPVILIAIIFVWKVICNCSCKKKKVYEDISNSLMELNQV